MGREEITFTRREMREFTGWSHMRVKRYLRQLVEMEYLLVDCGRHGFAHRYRLAAAGAPEGLVTWSGGGQGSVASGNRRNTLAFNAKTAGVVGQEG